MLIFDLMELDSMRIPNISTFTTASRPTLSKSPPRSTALVWLPKNAEIATYPIAIYHQLRPSSCASMPKLMLLSIIKTIYAKHNFDRDCSKTASRWSCRNTTVKPPLRVSWLPTINHRWDSEASSMGTLV